MNMNNRSVAGATSGWRLPLSILLLAGSLSVQAAVCRVTFLGDDGNDGSSWASPMDLVTALADDSCDEIWVKAEDEKTYKPGIERSASFTIERELKLYGGFAGTETSLEQRVFEAGPTILSGDIGFPDDPSDNSYHVVLVDGTTARYGPITTSTVIDGFVITDGNADGSGGLSGNGGGLYCNGAGAGNECSPTLVNITFRSNIASDHGGAVYNDGGTGGASNPVLTNVTFSSNTSSNDGSAMANNGRGGTSSPAVTNATFSGNSVPGGGAAIYSLGASGGTSQPQLSNVILWGNAGAGSGAEMVNQDATPVISHSVIQDSGGSSGWDPALGTDQGGNLDADPMLGQLQDNGGSTPTMLPGADGSAIDTGDASTCPATDQRGVARPQGAACDIGAVELVVEQSGGLIFEDRFEQ